jgi:alkanesulfonate monooxygenase SsuD/methylene tetrahydromethanopterin reductase-like flavin-dependent oxidoreductase (luciferase family)
MRFSYAESMTDPSYYLPLARAAEEAGYDSMIVPDSICYPEVSDSRYPFNPDGTREFLDDKPFLEPFSLIPAMGAVTERLRFVTFVLKLPIRHPVLVAKQASSTAVLTNNRLLLGVGTSPWPEDYEVCDVPWAGHHEAALRRAAISGDGWLHGGGDPADLPGLLTRLAELRREHGTEAAPFEVHVISLDAYSVEGVHRLEELGVTDVIVGFRWPYAVGPDTEDLQTKIDNLRRFRDEVIDQAS